MLSKTSFWFKWLWDFGGYFNDPRLHNSLPWGQDNLYKIVGVEITTTFYHLAYPFMTDKASMLDEVIEYLKQLQAQVQMMNRMNIPPMMLPMAMQHQHQMSMMAPAMGMGMDVSVMDMNTIGRPNIAGISPIVPNPFMNMTSWDGSGERLQQVASAAAAMPDPLSAFMACQSQPLTMDAYIRLASMYQQMQQQPASGSKS